MATECRAPRSLARAASVVDGLARGRLAGDLGARLGPSLDRIGGVVRIRRLPLRVIIRGADLDEAKISERWVGAFVQALFQALACPSGEGPYEVARYASRAEELAALVRDALAGVAARAWQYASFRTSGVVDDPGRVFALCESAAELRELLLALGRMAVTPSAMPVSSSGNSSVLDELLLRFDDIALEALFARIARVVHSSPTATTTLTIEDVIAVLALAQRLAAGGTATGALRQWQRSGDTHDTALRRLALRAYASSIDEGRSPRLIFHALLAARMLAESPSLFIGSRGTKTIEQITGRTSPEPVAELLRALRTRAEVASSLRDAVAGFAKTHLSAEVSGRLNRSVWTETSAPHQIEVEDEATWIASDFAALLLLAPLVQRLGWLQYRHDLGPIAFSSMLVDVAEEIVALVEPDRERPDPASLLFAGWVGAPSPRTPGEWQQLADELLSEFRSRIRGFRQSPFAAIVRQFIRNSGRIRIEERRLTVVLDPTPFHVALHLGSADESIDSLDWIGGRRLDFVLEGL
jgi:hypothetical protein